MIKTRKIVSRLISTSDITKEVLLRLRAQGCTVWRNSTWSAGKRKNIITPGIPDVIGYGSSGVFLGCEIKKIGDVFSQEQKEFLRTLKRKGGIALWATQEGGSVVIKIFSDEEFINQTGKRKQAVSKT